MTLFRNLFFFEKKKRSNVKFYFVLEIVIQMAKKETFPFFYPI